MEEIKITDEKNPFHEIAEALDPHKEKITCSVEFVVEGSVETPIITIKYPGRKVKARNLTRPRPDSAHWENLYDFQVVPYKDGEELSTTKFTFESMINDFSEYKKANEEFWKCVESVYNENKVPDEVPKLGGIDAKLFLYVLKWIWLEEDFNYKYSSKDIDVPTRYKNSFKGVGRGKFFGALVLVKNGFTPYEAGKVVGYFR